LINFDLLDTYTVLVLGAGASAHLGYPLGSRLCDNILESTKNPTAHSFIQLHEMGFSENDILAFNRAFGASALPAIDVFLGKRNEFLELGRAAIACELVKYEDEDRLRRDRQDNWYFELPKKLTAEIDRNYFGFVIVTFNYDRSLDKFLHDFFSATYPQKAQSSTIEHYVPILHVHGRLGYLEHQTSQEPRRPYKVTNSSEEILASSKCIQVPVELQNKHSQDMVEAQCAIQEAKRVVFLGFGYDTTNLRRLGIHHPMAGVRWTGDDKYFGTAYDLPKLKIEELSKASERRLILADSSTRIRDYLRNETCWMKWS
jgi:hypothetical protein